MDEIAAAFKKMKRHKAPGMSGLVAEMIQCTGDIGTQWILDLCNGIVKEGCIPEDWKSIYKTKVDSNPMECGSYRAITLLEHAMKVVERKQSTLRHLQRVNVCKMLLLDFSVLLLPGHMPRLS